MTQLRTILQTNISHELMDTLPYLLRVEPFGITISIVIIDHQFIVNKQQLVSYSGVQLLGLMKLETF